jgi:hypothetical protein
VHRFEKLVANGLYPMLRAVAGGDHQLGDAVRVDPPSSLPVKPKSRSSARIAHPAARVIPRRAIARRI